jgi:hypothetical protein
VEQERRHSHILPLFSAARQGDGGGWPPTAYVLTKCT